MPRQFHSIKRRNKLNTIVVQKISVLAEATETTSISQDKNLITIAASGSRSDNFASSKEIFRKESIWNI